MNKNLGSSSDGGTFSETSNGMIIISCPHMHDYCITIQGRNEKGEIEKAKAFFNHPAGGSSPNGWKHTRKAIIELANAINLDYESEGGA